MVDRQAFVDLDYNTSINTNLALQLRSFHHWYDYHSTEVYLNTDNEAARSLGFELQGERRWDNGRLFKVSWTYNNTDMRDDFFNNHWYRAVNSPQSLIKAHYVEPLFNNRLRFGFEEIFVDSRRTMSNNSASAYHLFNINLALTKPIYGFEASLGLYNVLDQHPRMVGGPEHTQDMLRMDGRIISFRLEKSF